MEANVEDDEQNPENDEASDNDNLDGPSGHEERRRKRANLVLNVYQSRVVKLLVFADKGLVDR